MQSYNVKTWCFGAMICAVFLQSHVFAQEVDEDWGTSTFSIGTRVTHFILLDKSRTEEDAYLGNIADLDEDQNYLPLKIYGNYFWKRHWGVELTWDQIGADATNVKYTRGVEDPVPDGTAYVSGPILSLVYRYPNPSGWVPFAGVGLTLMSGSFEENNWWHYGYETEDQYIAAGSPTKARNGKSRTINIDDSLGFVASGGVDYYVNEQFSINGYVRYMYIVPEAEAVVKQGSKTRVTLDGEFDLSNVAFGLGVAYHF